MGTTPVNHLNLNVRGLGNSATVAINDRSNALRREGRQIFKLGLGQSPFPVPDAVVDSLKAHAAEKDYLPTAGLPALRDAVAAYTRTASGVERGGDDVVVGPGSKELMFLLQLVYNGELVIPAPSWVSYRPQAQIIGRPTRHIDTPSKNGWRLTPDKLNAICEEDEGRPRLLILNYPNNPTGLSYTTEMLAEIAAVARRHQILLLSDEIYGELHHEGQHESVAQFYPEGTIVSSGLSKWCGAGGWRLGTFVFPPELARLRRSLTAVASETFTSTAAPIQYASVRAFEGGPDIDDYLARSRRVVRTLGRWAARTLRDGGAECHDPEGGFYLFPSFEPLGERLRARGIETGTAFCERLLQDTGVAMLPGSAFGRPKGELTVRLAYVDFEGAGALANAGPEAVMDRAWLDAHCGNVTEAIERTVAWVRG